MQKIAICDFGCIFAVLESLLLKQTDIAPSNSEMFLKLFRSIDPVTRCDSTLASKKYDSEHAFFRKIREECLAEGELLSRIQSIGVGLTSEHLNHLDDVPSDELGAWCLIHGIIVGMKASSLSEPAALKYLDFLLAHCQIERDLIKTLRAKNHQSVINELSLWILLDSDHIGSDHAHYKVNHLAALIFYWAALYEKFLQIEHPDMDWAYTENQSQSMLVKYLPKVDAKGQKLSNSTWCFIEEYKDFIPSEEGKRKSDVDLYKAIYKIHSKLKSEVNEDGIAKTLKNIKSGKSALTVNFALKNLIPLTGREIPFDYQWDSSLMIIHFLNLFSKIQAIALKAGLSNTDTIAIFDRYPQYVDAAHSRFQRYEQCGILTPITEQPTV